MSKRLDNGTCAVRMEADLHGLGKTWDEDCITAATHYVII
mgnify:CR=1 FL=1